MKRRRPATGVASPIFRYAQPPTLNRLCDDVGIRPRRLRRIAQGKVSPTRAESKRLHNAVGFCQGGGELGHQKC